MAASAAYGNRQSQTPAADPQKSLPCLACSLQFKKISGISASVSLLEAATRQVASAEEPVAVVCRHEEIGKHHLSSHAEEQRIFSSAVRTSRYTLPRVPLTFIIPAGRHVRWLS